MPTPLPREHVRARVARWLKKAMREGTAPDGKRWSQTSLAQRAGVSRETVWNLLNEKVDPQDRTIQQLADTLGVPYPLDDEGGPPARPSGGHRAPSEASESEENVRLAVREVERTIRAHVADPETLPADYLKQLRLVVVEGFIRQAKDAGRTVPDFLYRIHYEIAQDTFR